MTQLISTSSKLLQRALPLLLKGSNILDLACGTGRNGCYLASLGHKVTYLDRSSDALNAIKHHVIDGEYVCVDLETQPPYQLPKSTFDVVVVVRYLHRPLMNNIIEAIKPGGLIVYETFTHQQATIGRPKNPDFLLNEGELAQHFTDFESLYQFEGLDELQQAYIGQFIGRKNQD
jgi:tellurite methyltransferase